MNFEKLEEALTAALAKKSPVNEDALLPLVVDAHETEEERATIEDEGVFEELLPLRYLLSFGWESWGAPTSSSDSMALMTLGDKHFLCMPAESLDGLHPFLVYGSAPVSDGAAGVSALVRQHLPQLFGMYWAYRLPTDTTNSAPDLLSADAVKDAYRAVASDPDIWEGMISDLTVLVSDTDPLGRPTGAPNTPVPEGDRAFDRWFELTYEESGT